MVIADVTCIVFGFLQFILGVRSIGSVWRTVLLCLGQFATLIHRTELHFKAKRDIFDTALGMVGIGVTFGGGSGYMLGLSMGGVSNYLQVPLITLVLLPVLLFTAFHPPEATSGTSPEEDEPGSKMEVRQSVCSQLRALITPAEGVPLGLYISLELALVTHFMFVGGIELIAFLSLGETGGYSPVDAGLIAVAWVCATVVAAVMIASGVICLVAAVMIASGVICPLQVAKRRGLKLDQDQSKVVAAAFPFLINAGFFLGFTIAGLLYEPLGYFKTMGTIGAASFLAVVVTMWVGLSVPGWLTTLCIARSSSELPFIEDVEKSLK